MQWRQPPERVNHLHGDLVEFGRGRSRGRGYLAHSDRVGPGVLLLDPRGQRRADALNAEGFSVLVPEPGERDEGRVLEAAAEYLSANWHPRLGIIAIGSNGVSAAAGLVRRGLEFEVLVLVEGAWPGEDIPPLPLVGHFSGDFDPARAERLFDAVAAAGHETELYIYDGTHDGFSDPRSDAFDADAAALAEARTLDALEYYLS